VHGSSDETGQQICNLSTKTLSLSCINPIFVAMNADFWNQRYSEEGWAYGEGPNEFFRCWLAYHKPGRLLLPCEGEGRQALYAARKGWQVEAFDLSEAGMNKALSRAKSENLQIVYRVGDASNYHSPPVFDGVASIYAHLPVEVRRQAHRNLVSALKEGGWLLLEGFHTDQLGKPSGGPQQQPDMLFRSELLEEDFQGMEVLLNQVLTTRLDEGKYHRGEASICRFIARKPLTSTDLP
jgi:SAM-dependent methyltransferase